MSSSSPNAKFDIGFVNLKFPRTSSNDFANFLPPLVIIDFINELRSRQTCGTSMGAFVGRSLTVRRDRKETSKETLCLITIEIPSSRIPRFLNPPLYEVIQGKKNGNELLAPSTKSICKKRKNREGPVTVRSHYNATGRLLSLATGFT